MADLTLAASTYASSGSPDTASTLQGGTDEVQAEHQNYPNGAIIGLQTLLGNALTLKGSVADLVARLAVLLEANGKMKNLSTANKTTFPGTVSEGMTGATSFTASQLIRKHASNDVLESSGLTVAAGTSGDVVTVTSTQTLTNKTLTTPTIGSLVNATHTHTTAAGGGVLAGNGVVGTAASFVTTVLDSVSSPNGIDTTATTSHTTVGSSKVMVMAKMRLASYSDGTDGDTVVRILRDSPSNVVDSFTIPFGVTQATPSTITLVGLDSPSAGTYTYKVNAHRTGSAGTDGAITLTDISIVSFTVV